MSTVSQRIRQRRESLNLSQAALAEISRISQAQISRYEKGENDPTGTALVALADALEVSVDWLLGHGSPISGDLSEDERALLEIYRQKPPEAQRKLIEVAKVL